MYWQYTHRSLEQNVRIVFITITTNDDGGDDNYIDDRGGKGKDKEYDVDNCVDDKDNGDYNNNDGGDGDNDENCGYDDCEYDGSLMYFTTLSISKSI